MARPTAPAGESYRRLGVAIRQARKGVGWLQGDLGMALKEDERGRKPSQAAVSDWENGHTRVDLDRIAEIEDVLGLQRGELLVEAGAVAAQQVPTSTPTEAAILADEALDEGSREFLVDAYRYVRRNVSSPGGEADRGDAAPPKTAAEFDVREALAEWDAEPAPQPPKGLPPARGEGRGPARSA